MTTLRNQISKNVIDAMNTSDNPRIDKEEGTKKRSHSSRAKASQEDEEHGRRKLRNSWGIILVGISPKYKKKER